jgi:hypothetical protein
MIFGWEPICFSAPMIPLRGPAIGSLIYRLKTSPTTSRFHLDTIRPGLQQSSHDLSTYRVNAVVLDGTPSRVLAGVVIAGCQ